MLTVGTSQHGFMLRAQAEPKGLACHSMVEASIENREDVRKMTIVWFEVEKDWWYGRKKLIGSLVSICCKYNSGRLAVGNYTELLATRARNKLLKYYRMYLEYSTKVPKYIKVS